MALTLADRIKQYTTSTGTGGLSFTGTPAGFAAFSSVLSSGDTTYYAVEENDKWEVGIGTYGSNNMARSQVLASSNGGNRVNLGGSGIVFITYPADRATYLNENDEFVLGASGLLFSNGTVFKEAKLTELTDVSVSGTVASTHVLSLNNTNKSLLLGDITGPSNSNNTLIGYGAASGITSAQKYVSIGTESAIANNAGIEGVSIGVLSGPSETVYTNPASYVVSVGYKAGSRARSSVTAIGHQAGMAAYETGFVAVGSSAGSGIGSYSVGIGNEAAHGMGSDYVVAVGYRAAKSAAGESAVWIGNMAGISASSSTNSIGIGYQAGKNSSATDSVYIGQSAGQSNSDDDYLYISNGPPSSNRTLIKGDMQSKRLAVGAADVTLEDTFYIGIASSSDKGLVVKSAAGQSDDLTQWQTSAGGSLASVSSLGIVTANQVVASGQGLKFPNSQIPTTPANTLYGLGGTLYWNLSPVTAPTGVETSVAFYNLTKAAIYSDDFTFDKDDKTLTVGNVSLKDNFININDTGKVKIGSYSGDGGITESDYSVILGHYGGASASGASYSFLAGYYSGYSSLNSHHSQIIGSSAGAFASGARNVYVGDSAGIRSSGDYNVFVGDGAGRKCVGSHNIEIIASGDSSVSPLNDYSNKIHIGQTIIGDTDARKLAFGLVSSSNVSPDATVEIFPKTDDLALKVHGSGEFASGVALPSAVPASTTNMLYNDAGTLKFNGSDIGGYDDTYVSGIAAYSSGVLTGGTPTFDDMYVGEYIYRDGEADTYIRFRDDQFDFVVGGLKMLTLDEATNDKVVVNEGGNNVDFRVESDNEQNLIFTDGQNDKVGIGTNAPAYRLDVVGHDAWAQASGIIVGNSGVVLANNSPAVTTNTLYNDGGTLSWNGSAVGGGASAEATYASGQAIENEGDIVATSGIAAYASGMQLNGIADVSYGGTNLSRTLLINNTPGSAPSHGTLGSDSTDNIAIGYASLSSFTDAIYNVAIGYSSTLSLTTGDYNIGFGYNPLGKLTTGSNNIAIGNQAQYWADDGDYNIGVGYNAMMGNSSSRPSDNNYNIAIGADTIGEITSGDENIGIGRHALDGVTTGSKNISIGTSAARWAKDALNNIAIGDAALTGTDASSTGHSYNIAIGTSAGTAITTGDKNIFIGHGVGQALTTDSSVLFIGNNSEASNGTLIKGDMANKYLAVGKADVTLSADPATLQVYANAATDKALLVQGAASQSDDLTSWQTSAGAIVAGMTPSGVLNAYGVVASGAGVRLHQVTPAVTTDTLYNVGGSLYFDGSAVGGGSSYDDTYVSGVAVYASGQSIENETDIVAVSGIANYASGMQLNGLADVKFDGTNFSRSFLVNTPGSSPSHGTLNNAENNVGIGYQALSSITSADKNIAFGYYALKELTTGPSNIAIGFESQRYANDGSSNIALGQYSLQGKSDGTSTTGNSYNIAIGDYTARDITTGDSNIAMGTFALDKVTTGSNNIGLGDYALQYVVDGSYNTAIGRNALQGTASSTGQNYNTAIGALAGYGLTTGDKNIFLGYTAGYAHTSDDSMLYIANNQESANGTLIKGDMANKYLAVGKADVTLSTDPATLQIYSNGATDKVLLVQGFALQSDDLTSWQTSAGAVVAGMTPSGVLNAYGVVASGAGVRLHQVTPAVTTDTLYNVGGSLYFDGSAVGGGGGDVTTAQLVYVSGLAVYGSGQAQSLGYASGVAAYASGQAIENETAIATNVSNISTNTSNVATNSARVIYASGQAIANESDIVATSGIANYASGQAIANENDIVAVSGISNYASGQAIENEGLITYASGNTANIAFGSNVEGDILYHNGTKFIRLAKGTNNHVLTMDGNVPNWEAAAAGSASAEATYASGQAIANESDIVATSGIAAYASGHVHNDLYVSGIAAYASGQAIANETDIATNVTNIATNSARVTYASGLAITNESEVAYASGQAIANESDIVATSGIAAYASGQAISNKASSATNAGNISTNTSNISTNSTNITATTAVANYASGEAVSLNSASGVAAYASGEVIAIELAGLDGSGLWSGHNRTNTLLLNRPPGESPYYGIGSDCTDNVGIGYHALRNIAHSIDNIALGKSSSESLTTGDRNVSIGSEALKINQVGHDNVALGYNALWTVAGSRNIGIGKSAGYAETGSDMLYIAKGTESANGTIIKASMSNKWLAIGKADVNLAWGSTPDPATLQIYPNAATDKVLLIQGYAAQSDDLTSWQTSAGSVVAGMTPSGVLNTYGVVASGAGVRLHQVTPTVTTDTLYNVGGSLYFDGSAVGGGTSAEATYASGQAIANESDIVATSGIANYASGQAISNKSSIATNTSNISTNTSNISTNVTNITSTTAVANYASGEALSLNAASGQVVYASGQAIANESDIVAVSGISNYASGLSITTEGVGAYASGQAIANETDIATNSGRVTYASGLAITNEGISAYASGQAIENEADVLALLAASGQAVYASGNTANIAFGSNAEGDILYHNGTSFTRLAKGTDNHVLTMDGNVPNWEASSGGGGTSAEATYASGQAIANESDIVATSGIAAYASGQVNVTTDGTAEASKALILDSAKTFTGVKDGNFSQFDSWVKASGVNVGASGIILGGTAVTATAAELNYLDITTLGTAQNSKAFTRAADATATFAGTTIADLGTVTTADINGGTIDGATIATSNVTVGSSKTLDVSGGTLTLAANQISGDKVEGGTIAATTITALTTAGITATANIDIGGYDLRAATVTADGLTSGRVVFAGTAGLLSDDADLTFSGDTLTATKIKVSDGGTIGSASDADVITIATEGDVTFSKATKPALKANSDGSTVTFDLNEANVHTVTLGGNRTFAISNETAGQKFIIRILQDGTGSRLVSTWFSTIKWAGGSAPTLTTTAGKADVVGFIVTGTDTYDGFVVGQNI